METSNNAKPTIRIIQSVTQDVWNIQKKQDSGIYVMKRADANSTHATNSAPARITFSNSEQTGAKPKIHVQPQISTEPKIIILPKEKKSTITVRTSVPKPDTITINAANPSKRARKDGKTVIAQSNTNKEASAGSSIRVSENRTSQVITINTIPTKNKVITISANPVKSENATTDGTRSGNQNAPAHPEIQHSLAGFEEEENMHLQAEALQISEMFPHVPVDMIYNDLLETKNAEITIDKFLEQTLVIAHEPVSSVTVRRSDSKESSSSETVRTSGLKESSSSETVRTSGLKESSSSVKIELLSNDEIWDVSKKETQDYVMKKATPSSSSTEVNKSSTVEAPNSPNTIMLSDDSSESDEVQSADEGFDTISYQALSDKPSKNSIEIPSTHITTAATACKEKSPTEISDVLEEESMDADELFDDANESFETIESFLFRASVALRERLRTLKSKNTECGDAALLNITGNIKSAPADNTNMVEDYSDDGEFYSDENHSDDE